MCDISCCQTVTFPHKQLVLYSGSVRSYLRSLLWLVGRVIARYLMVEIYLEERRGVTACFLLKYFFWFSGGRCRNCSHNGARGVFSLDLQILSSRDNAFLMFIYVVSINKTLCVDWLSRIIFFPGMIFQCWYKYIDFTCRALQWPSLPRFCPLQNEMPSLHSYSTALIRLRLLYLLSDLFAGLTLSGPLGIE